MKKKQGNCLRSSNLDIPDRVFESLARSLLPVIVRYSETKEGQKEFEAWKEQREVEKE